MAAAPAALLTTTGQAQAQSCTRTEHLGTLRSHQTTTRTALLSAASRCRFDGVRYYDWYEFALSGAGTVTAEMVSRDFPVQVIFNTSSGEFLASRAHSLTRTLPAGQYRLHAVSNATERAGSYTLTIRTGRLAAPPPPPVQVVQEPDPVDDDEQLTPPADTEDAEPVRGYVIARVHSLPENDRRGDYRIEFGFLSEEVLASGSDRTAVVAANEHLLPPRRYLNEASMLDRARANNRNWLRSSPIDVFPLEGDDATLSGEPLLTGRVIARWNPTAGGRFRIEFGFLPNDAFEAAGDDTERAAEMYAHLLPTPGRYLTESRINSEANRSTPRWLTSSLVEIPLIRDGCEGRPVTITPIAVPLQLPIGERIINESIAMISGELGETFTPVTVQDLPAGLEWDLAETRADGCEHQLTVSGTIPSSTAPRSYSVQITAEGADGERTPGTIRIETVGGPEIVWDGYRPASTSVGGRVSVLQPRVTSPIPAPPGVVWEFVTSTPAICSVDEETGALTLSAEGVCQVTVTASAPGYARATATAQVTSSTVPPPLISWSGYARSSVEYGQTAPTLVPPSATLNGRPIFPEYRYSVAPTSANVCSVTASGTLTINAVGECRVNVENVAKPPEYGVGTASASVTVTPGDPMLSWGGYSPETARVGDQAPTLERPTAASRTITFSYRSLDTRVCRVDATTGALTPLAKGTCIVEVSTGGDTNYRTDQVTRRVESTTLDGPVIDRIDCVPESPREGQGVTCWPTLSGGDPETYEWRANGGGSPSSGTRQTFFVTFDSRGSKTVSLTVRNTAGDDNDSTTVTVSPPGPEPTISCSPSSIDERESVTCRVTGNNGGDIDRYLWSANGGSPDRGSSATYSPRFDRAGRYTVSLTASNDGVDGDSNVVTVTVTGVNRAPECDIPSYVDLTLERVGRTATMSVADVCTDPDGDSLRFRAASSSTAVASVSAPSGSRGRFEITAEGPGRATITVYATDPDGLSDSASHLVIVEGGEPPDPTISCSPSTIEEGESVTCEVTRNRGGDIVAYSWSANSGSPSSSRSSTYSPRFSREGRYTVSLNADNDHGRGSDTYTVRVAPQRPDLRLACTAAAEVNGTVNCTVSNSGGAVEGGYSWSPTGSRGAYPEMRRFSFSQYGEQTIRVSGSNAGGSDSTSLEVSIVAPRPSTGYARCGRDTIKVYWFDPNTYHKHWLNMTWEEVAARVPGWGEHMIGHLSQSACNSWPDGTTVTTTNWGRVSG